MNIVFKGHELFMALMQDHFKKVQYGSRTVVTSFLTLPEQQLVQAAAPKNIQVAFAGGFDGAERKRALLFQDYEPEAEIVILKSRYNSTQRQLRHPDVLGALMHQGIERDQIGDILVRDDEIILACTAAMADYICAVIDQIARCRVHFEPVQGSEDYAVAKEVVQINASSLRLDAAVAALAHVSRAKAMTMIRQGLVKLNDVVLEENKALCDNDFVSIRRCGRFHFLGVDKTTRKNRLILKFEKYI